ncbi:sensor histidine kinase [Halopseudomonas salegens]|uniref:histidine kinase n=1 Tax=Halopseudomonas salegens TaxID=1434072 RepID=A0A1H2G404_9GAMM|nr:ATP-binding protein [Halopseudomonas salegens]SDU14323.1 PAS/PAC sensor signal transduction histidine kinase [Halopseudomonas salegens]
MAAKQRRLSQQPHLPADDLPAEQLELERAQALLGRVTERLGASEALLERQLGTLRAQLAEAHAQRAEEAAENGRLAARLQNLLDLLPGGVVVLDGQGRVHEANPAACELLGEPLEGQLWRDIINERFAPRDDDYHEVSLRSGRRVSLATRSLRGEPGQLILLTDLTETRELQAELARHERLSALGRMVASLAHQIRTPLSTALLYASHLTDPGLAIAHRQRFADRLKGRLQSIEHQVRDMLLFARGDLPLPDQLTPADLLAALQQQAEPVLDQASASCRWVDLCPAGSVLRCNQATLLGAIQNLLDNAMQAVGPGAHLKVALRELEGQLSLTVVDTGPGLSNEQLQGLGEPFQSHRANGTGLGLAVVKSVTRAHGGSFFLRSKPGRGTCVELLLPLQHTGQQREAS